MKKLTFSCLLIVLLSTFAIAETIYVKKNGVNIRNGPGINYIKIGRANKGQEFEVIKEQSGWYRVNIGGGKIGWIYGKLASKKIASKKPVSKETASKKPVPKKIASKEKVSKNIAETLGIVYVIWDAARIKSGPGIYYRTIRMAKNGQEFEVLKEGSGRRGTYYKISLGEGKVGWIWEGDVSRKRPESEESLSKQELQ